MSLSPTLRRAITHTRAFSSTRHAAQSSNATELSHEKLRALVTMYHQAETFVTLENLDEKIQEAFLVEKNQEMNKQQNIRHSELVAAARARSAAPKVTEWNANQEPRGAIALPNSLWSASTSIRDAQVKEALYGVSMFSDGKSQPRALPGLEVLLDEQDVLQKSAAEDAAAARYDDRD